MSHTSDQDAAQPSGLRRVLNGEEIIIAKELTPSYTAGKKLGRKEDATDKELEILEAWLRGQ